MSSAQSTSASADTRSTASASSTSAPSSSSSASSASSSPVSSSASSSVTERSSTSSSASHNDHLAIVLLVLLVLYLLVLHKHIIQLHAVPVKHPKHTDATTARVALPSGKLPRPSSADLARPVQHAHNLHHLCLWPTHHRTSPLTSHPHAHFSQVITPVPTALSPSPTSPLSPHRAATIAGTALAVLFLLLLILVATFIYRRHRRKLRERLDALIRGGKSREHRGLLDGEDFFDEDEDGMGLKTYRDRQASATTSTQRFAALGPPGHAPLASAASTISSTRTTTPVGIPPLAVPDTLGSGLGLGLGLGGLVDSVMGRRSVHSLEPEQGAASMAAAAKTPPPIPPPPGSTPLYIPPFRPGSAHEESVYFDLAGLPLPSEAATPPVTAVHSTVSPPTTTTTTTSPTHTAAASPTAPVLQASTSNSSSSISPLPPGAAPPRRGV
ncbi:hypothetical protein C0993_001902 [Termitomyces sp. T159_Od127]|nr:hypothetical protein C0993_001902 [Termitomyces sp. T159_Od127]